MVRLPHQPGVKTHRAFSGYSAAQDAKFRILEDLAYSEAFGFAACRQPTPGTVLSIEYVTERVTEVERAWRGEAPRESGARGMRASDLSAAHQAHLAERLLEYPRKDSPLSIKEGY